MGFVLFSKYFHFFTYFLSNLSIYDIIIMQPSSCLTPVSAIKALHNLHKKEMIHMSFESFHKLCVASYWLLLLLAVMANCAIIITRPLFLRRTCAVLSTAVCGLAAYIPYVMANQTPNSFILLAVLLHILVSWLVAWLITLVVYAISCKWRK